ncbi:hypothetical protein AMS60_21670 [Bacillus sp. FJAT-21945]|nr:hypothetical protein AMS60_21670 [Bacillus sp. FJAT-21945]
MLIIFRQGNFISGHAEALALKRDYKKAMKLLEHAQLKRPDYYVLQDSIDMIGKAMEYKDDLGKVSGNIKKTHFNEAYATVVAIVSAEERKNGSIILSKYKATYEIRYENDQLKLISGKAEKIN